MEHSHKWEEAYCQQSGISSAVLSCQTPPASRGLWGQGGWTPFHTQQGGLVGALQGKEQEAGYPCGVGKRKQCITAEAQHNLKN